MCENNDHHRQGLWVGRVDQKYEDWLAWSGFKFVVVMLDLSLITTLFSLHVLQLIQVRGVNVNKRTVTTHSYILRYGIRLGHFMSRCLFSFAFIGHI